MMDNCLITNSENPLRAVVVPGRGAARCVTAGKIGTLAALAAAFVFAGLAQTLSAAEPLRLYVSALASADGRQDGSAQKPFASLEAARDAIREHVSDSGYPAGGVIVEIAEGMYCVERGLQLGAEDSGRPGAPVVYRGMGNVRFSGGVTLQAEDLSPVTDSAVLARLPAEARGRVMQADLRALGVEADFDPMPLSGHSMDYVENVTGYRRGPAAIELFFGGRALPVARWPNDGYAVIASVVEQGSVPRNWQEDMVGRVNAAQEEVYVAPADRDNPPRGFAIRIDTDRPLRWAGATEAMLFGYWFYNWSDQTVEVGGIAADGTIRSVQPSAYGVKAQQPFFVYNLLEELDAPGEWYLDRKAGMLYLLPPAGGAMAGDIELSVLSQPFVECLDASYITFEDIAFATARGDGITVRNGREVVISGCRFEQFAGRAVNINGGSGHAVLRSTITNTGEGGILLNAGSRKTLQPAGLRAEHNEITHFARLKRTYTPAIDIKGVGNRAIANRISEGPHVGIRFDGNDHVIEGNSISRVCLEADDMGAIYAGRDTSGRGTLIRYNYIFDIPYPDNVSKPIGRHGVYLDDQFSGTRIENNVFSDISGLVVVINGGRDNAVLNNTFVMTKDESEKARTMSRFAAVAISNIGMDARRHSTGRNGLPPIADPEFLSTPAYAKYPNFVNVATDQPSRPKYNTVEGNTAIGIPMFFFHNFRPQELSLEEVLQDNIVRNNTQIEPGP
ncbi:right-handed parallel beta-helix repeat-containing protein [Ruficoccus amylovorans]|uniref:Right-handed parallel beta-helix repeat-containing protein n=1 Tax=Ruficoccus amylovorans TaxID=1804625 RepID=A0A842HDB3_9BACT|nr:right-handed parallel beta-helix repeat-containing protein [Ruficoccus amylovorans]MBC2594422.1 right-handed parallel beta-helix repeat-containing protein [Ruficoccus amylovorans]